MNPSLRTGALFLVLTAILVGFGWVIGSVFFGDWVLMVALFLFVAVAMNAIAYFFADKIVLMTYRARIVTEAEAPMLYRIVRRVAAMSNLPMPRVAIVPSPTPNAFATGRNPKNAVVAVTEGMSRVLEERELTGVIAHELSHIKDRDILVMSIAATIAGALTLLARVALWSTLFGRGRRNVPPWVYLVAILGLILVPIGVIALQMAISRSREYKADHVGAKTLGAPDALADALEQLEYRNRQNPMAFGSPTSANLWIVNPFQGGAFVRMFSSHPPIEERVKKLRQLAKGVDTY
ncbi:MAG TPA: zinc metalloprotease HtpX [Thermoplasmata archaeon]|jgi:heat shock protein HtpX|nr:zinc metalloprotease HtpX [Thermoplasmata archaeon]